MATRAEIKQAMVSRVIQEGLIDPATGQPMSAMDSVLEAVTDGIVMVEGGGPHSSTHITGGTDVIPNAVPDGASGLMSGADKAKLDGIEAGAQVNQNAFSYVKVGATTIGADSKTDTLELAAGTNIALTPDATNDKVTIAVTGMVSSAQNSDTVDGKHASDLALIGHGHTGGSDGNQIGTSGLQDGAVTDAKIGNRTVDQTQAPTGSTGTLTQLLSWLANRIKAMAGATNWFDNPAASLASIWAKFNAGTGHKHTGAADDAPQVDYASIANKPGSFPPSLHASSHHSGGGDALSLGSVAGTLTDTQHGNRGGGTLHSAATASAAGFMSASDKVKLDGVQSGAEVNQNAFSSVKVVDSGGVSKGQADADAKTDVLTLKESTGISLSVDVGTDTITIAATGGGLPAAHASTHVTGGTDVIPDAVAGGASGLMSGADKQKLDGIQAGAEVNQNAFSNVLVGGTVIAADSKTDTLELVAGTSIALTPDATNDKVTIAVSGTVASASNADTVDGKHASDFVQNAGGTPSIQAGPDASKPAAGTAGRLYLATDTHVLYRDDGAAWAKMATVDWDDIDSKPSAYPPSAHKSTHASGGDDALTPGDIGAETPTGAQAKVDAHAFRTDNPHDTTAAQVGAVPVTGGTMTGTLRTTISAPMIVKFTGYKSWIVHHPATNSLILAPSATADGEDWDWTKAVEILDTGGMKIAGNVVWHAGNDGAGSGLDAGLLEGKRWVTVASGSVSIAASGSTVVSLLAGGAHHYYLVSAYSSVDVVQHEISVANCFTWTLRQRPAGSPDALILRNESGATRTIYYSVLAWE